MCDEPRPVLLGWLVRFHSYRSLPAALGLLISVGSQSLSAATPPTPHGLTVQRTPQAVQHKYAISPDGPTIPPNRSQRFSVTDVEGRPVEVRWNVSGLGCSGSTCGTIDDQGVYRTPASLPEPRVVTLEGVLVSDPNYSVLTRIRLEEGIATPTVGAHNISSRAKLPELPAVVAPPPVATNGRVNLGRSSVLPPLHVVAAAPSIQNLEIARNSGLPSLPNPIGAAPVVKESHIVRNSEFLPLTNATPPAPSIETADTFIARTAELPSFQQVVPAPPTVGRGEIVRKGELLRLPEVIAAAPRIEQPQNARVSGLPALPTAIAAPPAVEAANIYQRVQLPSLPHPVSAAPAIEAQDSSRGSKSLPLPSAIPAAPVPKQSNAAFHSDQLLALAHPIAAAPGVERSSIAGSNEWPALSNPVPVAPQTGELSSSRRHGGVLQARVISPPPAVEEQNVKSHADLLPLPKAIPGPPAASEVSTSRRDQLPLLAKAVIPPPPVLGTRETLRPVGSPLPSNVVGAAPAMSQLTFAPAATLPPLPNALAPKISSAHALPPNARPLATPRQANQAASNTLLMPLPEQFAMQRTSADVAAAEDPAVSYRDGQLTINAQDLTLAEVLKLVAERTGATIDIPEGTGLERIVEHSGPGPANDVITSLLNGSHFNFIIVSSSQNPHEPAEVLLSLQGPESGTSNIHIAHTKKSSPSPLWTPPDDDASVAITPPQFNSSLTPPKEPASPEALGEMMKQKARELREQAQREAPPQ